MVRRAPSDRLFIGKHARKGRRRPLARGRGPCSACFEDAGAPPWCLRMPRHMSTSRLRARARAVELWRGCSGCPAARRDGGGAAEWRELCVGCAAGHFAVEAGGARASMPACPCCRAPVLLCHWAPLAPAAAAALVERVATAASVVCKGCDRRVALTPPCGDGARPAAEAAVVAALEKNARAAEFRAAAAEFYAGRSTAHAVVDIARATGVSGGAAACAMASHTAAARGGTQVGLTQLAALVDDDERRGALAVRWCWAEGTVATDCCGDQVCRDDAGSPAHCGDAIAPAQICFRCGASADSEESPHECFVHAIPEARRCPSCNSAIGEARGECVAHVDTSVRLCVTQRGGGGPGVLAFHHTAPQ